MRTLLVASLALAVSSTLAACGCSSWSGQDDTMLASERGDAILVCGNGGFAAMLANGDFIEGWATLGYADDGTPTYSYVVGETGAPIVFEGTFAQRPMDRVERDHADVLCVDLEARVWWSAPVAQ